MATHKIGRPPKWKSVKELQSQIEQYLDATPIEEWTITGLALSLKTTRKTLCDYTDKPEFLYTIKRAKAFIEHSYELDLKRTGGSGPVFALKNFGWKDKIEQKIDQKTEITERLPDELMEMIKK